MPTENPKISAYVPQVVYDRFKEFQEERELSMSQAAIEIFAHYFEINLEVSTKEFTGGLPGKLMEIERELIEVKRSLAELKEFCNQLASEVKHTQTTSRLLDEDTIENLDAQSVVTSELSTEPKSSIPLDSNELEAQGELVDNLQGELLKSEIVDSSNSLSESNSKLPIQLELESGDANLILSNSPDELLHSLPIDNQVKPLKVSDLAKHLSLSDAMLHKVKKYEIDKQIEYTSSKSPEKRSWVFLEFAKLFYPLKISEKSGNGN